MARPTKEGLDYFPLDVDIDRDDDVYYIEAKHGLIGFAVLIRLYMRIYDNGYYCKWTEKEQMIFSRQVNVDKNTLSEIVNDCIEVGLLDADVYKKYSVLTSKGIQKRFLEAVNRRKEVHMIREYILVDINDYSNLVIESINSGSNEVNVNNNHQPEGINDDIMSAETPQSKVKKSKVKKSRVNNYRPNSESSPDPSQEKSKPANQEEGPDNLPAKPEDNGPKFDEESIPYKAACYLRAKILENNKRAQVPNKDPASMEAWATEMDRLNRLGPVGAKESENKGYTWEEIGKIIDWCQQDPFWKSNILSAGKLREKIVTLENQMKNRSSPRNKQARKDEMLRELYQEAMEEDRQGNTEVNVL
ncbi:MAG: hypothetical protein PWR10_1811 [Halanaerobiales bacterium]|nr:hypothetical protein [Halanaerobiales bacterium]